MELPQHPSTPKYVTKNIEELRVGLVIPAHNPEGGEKDALNLERPNPETWRQLELVALKRDGSVSEIMLLRPLWWLEEQQAEIGGEVWVEVPECGISSWAQLLSIGPCPTIDDKDGEVVTGTYKHHVASVLDIWIEGEPEPIGTTPNHPFWCEDANTFVRADALTIGSTLRLLDGLQAKVQRIKARPSQHHTVYNLEVHSQHTYFVGQNGVLVHNSGVNPCAADDVRIPGKIPADPLTDQEALRQAIQMRQLSLRTVDASELKGARPWIEGGTTGHPDKHGFKFTNKEIVRSWLMLSTTLTNA